MVLLVRIDIENFTLMKIKVSQFYVWQVSANMIHSLATGRYWAIPDVYMIIF